jgi:hypothetical protein
MLFAAFITALGGIVHSGTVWRLSSSGQEEDETHYDWVGSSPHRRPSFLDATPKFQRTKYTFDSFVVAGGIDLAGFGLDERADRGGFETPQQLQPQFSFQLFEDFDLSQSLKGNETWIELLEYRRDATHPSLSFYVDKVAFKRWLITSYADLKIEGPKSFLLKYASELHREAEFVQSSQRLVGAAQSTTSTEAIVAQELLKWLPTDLDYAAKPTHLSCSGGVWLVHNDLQTNTTYVGNGKKKMKAFVQTGDHKKTDGGSSPFDLRNQITEDLSKNLEKVQEKCGSTVLESYALRHVRPGIVVEERFTQPNGRAAEEGTTHDKNINDDDDEALLKGGMEFKVFTIWGRAWLTVWRPGTDGVKALFFRNGTSLVFEPPVKKNKSKSKTSSSSNPKVAVNTTTTTLRHEIPPLPEWIDWDRVISIGETLGRHKDMFRTDIFVGVATASNHWSSNSETSSGQVRYVVSETEIHPTPLRGFEAVFEEAGRLWLAGYYLLSKQQQLQQQAPLNKFLARPSAALSVVPNTEVPRSFYHPEDR